LNIISPIKDFIENHLEAGQRLEICKTCNYSLKENTICDMCGCQLYIKVVFPNSRCPMGKW